MGVRFLRFASLHMSNSSLRHSGMRRKAQTRNPSRRSYAGEMGSGFDASHRPGMTAVHCWRSSAFPRGKSPPGDLVVPPKTEGAGNAGCSVAPAASRANEKSTRASHHRFAETLRHSPRNGFNGFLRGLPGEPGLLPPSPAAITTGLIPASGYQDATTSPSATGAFVLCACRVHRIFRPTFSDDRETPLLAGGRRAEKCP